MLLMVFIFLVFIPDLQNKISLIVHYENIKYHDANSFPYNFLLFVPPKQPYCQTSACCFNPFKVKVDRFLFKNLVLRGFSQSLNEYS